MQVVAIDLFEVTEFVLGQHACAAESVVPALRGTLVLDDFRHGLHLQSKGRVLLIDRVREHQAAGQVAVVRNREHVAAVAAQ